MSVRQPLVIAIALVSLIVTVGCSKSVVEIYAPPEFAEGHVIIDGAPVAKLSKPRYNYRWRGWRNVRDELSAPPRHESFAAISKLAAGSRDLSLVKEGYVPIRVRFNHRQDRASIIDVWHAKVQRTPATATQ